MKSGPGLDRILYFHTLRSIDVAHGVHHIVEVTLLGVELIDKEDDWLFELLRVAEYVLRAYLRAILTIDENHGLVGDVEGCDGTSHEVVGARTVDNIQLLIVPFHMEYRWENGVTIFLLHGEIIAHGVMLFHRSATLG